MKYLFLLLALFTSLVTTAQKKKIQNPKPFAESIQEADLKKHLSIVAGKEMEGRETATEGQRKAAAYIESQFKSMGLAPGNQGSYQLMFPVYQDSIVSAKMVVNGKSLVFGQDFRPSVNRTNTGTMFFSEITFVGYGILDSTYNSYGDQNVAGKAVLVVDGGPIGFQSQPGTISPTATYSKIHYAQQVGASSIFIVVNSFSTTNFGNDYTNRFKPSQDPAVYYITEQTAAQMIGSNWVSMRQEIKTTLKEPLVSELELEIDFRKTVKIKHSSNVLGVLEGTDKKNEYLVITAHYDHLGKQGDKIYYGADDDGSGTVGVLEIAEAFAKAKASGKGQRRSIIFMTVSGEEEGLWGSEYYANHPTVNPDFITANLNIDMIGRVDTERTKSDSLNYVYVVGDDKLSTELKPISEATNSKYTKLSLDYKFNDPKDTDRIYYRSDHYNFAKIGVPIIFYYDGMLQGDYHKPTDTIEKINFKLLSRRAQLVFYTAWEMANREGMIRRDIPLEGNE